MVKRICKECGKEYDITLYQIEFDNGNCNECSKKELNNYFNYNK